MRNAQNIHAVGYNSTVNTTALLITWDAATGARRGVREIPGRMPAVAGGPERMFSQGVGASTLQNGKTTIAFPGSDDGSAVGINLVELGRTGAARHAFVALHPNYTTVSSVHLFPADSIEAATHPARSLGVAVASRQVGINAQWDVVLFNRSHAAAVSTLGGFPIYDEISCVDGDALMAVFDDGKYPCFGAVNLSTGQWTDSDCPSVNPDDAMWFVSDGRNASKLMALVSTPLGPGYDPRVHDLIDVQRATGQQGKTLFHNLTVPGSAVESVLPTGVIMSNPDGSTDVLFIVRDHNESLHAARLTDVLGERVGYIAGGALDTSGVEVLFAVRGDE